MADKQPHLNGAYYGPAIPPAEPPRHYRQHRSRGCLWCLFSIFWKIALTLIILAVIAGVIFWLVVQPRIFKFYVTEANLTKFDYNRNNNTLNYNMVLNFTARNPNRKLSIYYDKVEANAFYEDTWFNTADVITHMNSFRQYKKTTSPMSGVFSGEQFVNFDDDQIAKFNEDKSAGAFDIYVRLYFRIRFRLGDVISGKRKPKVKCHIRVPMNSNTTMTFFPYTKCKVDF